MRIDSDVQYADHSKVPERRLDNGPCAVNSTSVKDFEEHEPDLDAKDLRERLFLQFAEDIRDVASEPSHEILQGVDGDVLLTDLQTLQG